MTLSSTLKASGNSLICQCGSLVVVVIVGVSSLASIISGYMASPLAVGAFGTTCIGLCNIVVLSEWLLVLLVPHSSGNPYTSKVKCYNYKKEEHFAKNCKKPNVKDYEYYKTKMLLAKKDKDEQVLLAEDQALMESSSDSDQEINTNMVFLAQIEKVLSDSKASSSSVDEKISEVSYYLSESESECEFKTSEYYDNSTNYGLFVNNDDVQEFFHDAIES
nr:hypothetical protein [Tanacetum cinerariifolium]